MHKFEDFKIGTKVRFLNKKKEECNDRHKSSTS